MRSSPPCSTTAQTVVGRMFGWPTPICVAKNPATPAVTCSLTAQGYRRPGAPPAWVWKPTFSQHLVDGFLNVPQNGSAERIRLEAIGRGRLGAGVWDDTGGGIAECPSSDWHWSFWPRWARSQRPR